MYHYKVTRVSYFPFCLATFCSLIFLGELTGIIAAVLDGDWMNLVSGAFLGVILGIAGSLCTAITLFIFNTFIPITGGLSIQMTVIDNPPAKGETTQKAESTPSAFTQS